MHNVFNVSLLKPYVDNGQFHPPPSWSLLGSQAPEFEVEKIMDHMPKHIKPGKNMPTSELKQLKFLVRWKHFGPTADTWEPYSHLRHAPESLKEYGIYQD